MKERIIATVNAKSKAEAILGLEMLLKTVKEYPNESTTVSERVCVTNEGKKKF